MKVAKVVETAHVGAGQVEITLDGEKKLMKPTFRAAQGLSREYSGLSSIVQRIMNLDIEVITSVVGHGLSLTPEGKKGLDEKVYRTGASNLAPMCIRYISILANGGQPVKPQTDGEGTDDPNGVSG